MILNNNSLTFYDFIRLPLRFYAAAGVHMFQWNEDDIMTVKTKCFMVFLLITLTINFLAKSLYGVFEGFEDTVQLTQWFLYFSFAVNGFCKMLSVALGRKMLYKVLKDMEKIFPKTKEERREFHLFESYSYIMRHAKIVSIQHFIISTMFIVFPVIESSIEYFGKKSEVFVARTPYFMTYPFDVSGGSGYIFAYVSQLIGGYVTSCYFVGSDMLLICSVYLVIMQYEYLCKRIRNFKSVSYGKDMEELKAVLERHSLLNELAETVNDVFSFSTLLNYMISIIVIVMIAIQIITGSELLNIIKFVGFLTSATTQVYYVCMFSTKLMEHSSEVSQCLLGQEWYEADVRYQRMLVLGIARAQRPSHLTAFKFFMISMESFGNLMTTSYQFFTLLKTQMEEQQT